MRCPSPPEERGRAAAERQVPHADVLEELQAVLDLVGDARGNQGLALGQAQPLEDPHRVGHRQIDVLRDGAAVHAHRAALGLEATLRSEKCPTRSRRRACRGMLGRAGASTAPQRVENAEPSLLQPRQPDPPVVKHHAFAVSSPTATPDYCLKAAASHYNFRALENFGHLVRYSL
jgi:hypothetical protein